jgi:2-amino-4-hydroxy-6-hydroxymethyldihydropteridine diphosphokinase
VVVGLGSNLGDRIGYLQTAIDHLTSSEVLRTSPVYETPALGPPQPAFLNAAASFAFTCSPRQLLHRLLGIEAQMGRVRTERWGPRIVDLDILWIDGAIIDEPDLRVPHLGLLERGFALRPLLDLVPDAVDPRTGRRLAQVDNGWQSLTPTGQKLSPGPPRP